MPPLPPGGSPSSCCAGSRNDDFRATLDGAFARILEAHRCEVAELRQQLDAVSRQQLPREPVALLELAEVRVPHSAVICSEIQGWASDSPVAKPPETKNGWAARLDFAERVGGSDEVDTALSGSCSPVLPIAFSEPSYSEAMAPSPRSLKRTSSKRLSGPHWQWKHRTGWRDYDQSSSDKIEAFFQKGYPKARLKAGKNTNNPMEVFFADMVQHDASTGNTRDVRREGRDPWWQSLRRRVLTHYYAWDTGLPRKETLETARARKRTIELAGLGANDSKPDADAEQTLYHSASLFANVARSRVFQGCGTLLVALNAIWIAIALDNNDGPTPKVGFQVVENAFCGLFTLEVAIRFAAYRRKTLCLRDGWFCFDSALLLPMVLDTWLLPLMGILAGHERDDSVKRDLTILRVVRLLRLTRMIRLLKSMPMMMTLLKGITTSMRPVSIAVGLLVIIIYVFSIIFRSLAEPGGFLEREYFPSVTNTMLFLLMHGTFLDSVGIKGVEINREGGLILMFLFLLYIFMTSFLMLNMLIGVVCEMVSMVNKVEYELMAKVTLRGQLYDIMDVYDADGTGKLTQAEFGLFMQNVEVMQALHNFDVDIKALRILSEMMYSHVSQEDQSREVELTFDDIMSLAVRLKATSACRVEDIVKLREFNKHRLEKMEENLTSNQRMLEERIDAYSRRSLANPA